MIFTPSLISFTFYCNFGYLLLFIELCGNSVVLLQSGESVFSASFVQLCGQPRPWDKAKDDAADKFFKAKIDNSGADAYTGRLK